MTELQWAGDHPLLTAFCLWLVVEIVLKAWGRLLRAVMVSFKGWPPAHLDADGDWKDSE